MNSGSVGPLVDLGEFDEALEVGASTDRLLAAEDAWDLVDCRAGTLRVLTLRGRFLEAAEILAWLEPTCREIGGVDMLVIGLGGAGMARAALGQVEAAAELLTELEGTPDVRASALYCGYLPSTVRTALRIEMPELTGQLAGGLEPRYPLAEHALVAANAALAEARGDLEAPPVILRRTPPSTNLRRFEGPGLGPPEVCDPWSLGSPGP